MTGHVHQVFCEKLLLEELGDVPEPETYGHLAPGSVTPLDDLYGERHGVSLLGVSRAPTTRGIPGPGAYSYIPSRSVTPPLEEPYGEDHDAPLPGMSCALTTRGDPEPGTYGYISPPSDEAYHDGEDCDAPVGSAQA